MQTILVAEDDAVMHRALAELFELEGYEVVGARSVRDAAICVVDRSFDGAIVDWRLGDGFSDTILAKLIDLGIATVLLSAHPEARAVADAYGIPCVHKPFNVEQLLGIVSGAISRTTLRKIALSKG
jgi:DNA-binding NtrC family response regulator